MNKLYITDKKTIARNITEVQAALLMMNGIDYEKNEDGTLVFSVNYNDGYLFDVRGMIRRVLA